MASCVSDAHSEEEVKVLGNSASVRATCRSSARSGSTHTLDSQLLGSSDLIKMLGHDDLPGEQDWQEVKFRLQRADFLCKVCALVYADGDFWYWACRQEDRRPGDLSRGMDGASVGFRYLAGKYHQDAKATKDSPLGIEPLDSRFDDDWEWQPQQEICDGSDCMSLCRSTCCVQVSHGTIKDGLLHCSGGSFSGLDTQAIIALRGDRTLVIAFRGTTNVSDIVTDMEWSWTPWLSSGVPTDTFFSFTPLRLESHLKQDCGKVHRGMWQAFQSIDTHLMQVVKQVVQEYEINTVLCTGHSLGGGLATMCALRVAESRSQNLCIELYTFGGAVVGDAKWKEYFESMEPTIRCFRLVNDLDIIPTAHTYVDNGEFQHVGSEVHLNEEGLWLDARKARTTRLCAEALEDHQIHQYLRLLDYFSTVVRARCDQFEGPVQMIEKLHEIWERYNVPVVQFSPTVDTAGTHAGRRWTYSLQTVPHRQAMEEMLEKVFPVEHDEAIVEIEIVRLCKLYKSTSFHFPIFALACARLFCQSPEEVKQNQELARRYQQFALHDRNSDGYLNWEEFQTLMMDILHLGVDGEISEGMKKMVLAQFQKMDIDHSGGVSFMEYYVWRLLSDSRHTLRQFEDLTFRDDPTDPCIDLAREDTAPAASVDVDSLKDDRASPGSCLFGRLCSRSKSMKKSTGLSGSATSSASTPCSSATV